MLETLANLGEFICGYVLVKLDTLILLRQVAILLAVRGSIAHPDSRVIAAGSLAMS